MRYFYSSTEAEIWDLPLRLIEQDIQDLVQIAGMFNGVEPETTDDDMKAEAKKLGLKTSRK